ncbi:MAG: OmpA family protein [Erythrobacter sp.]
MTKFLVGAAGASFLAWGAHAVSGESYIDGLEEQGKDALSTAGIDNVSLKMKRDWLSRTALLDGVTDQAERTEVERVLKKGVPGLVAVEWPNGDGNGGKDAGAATSGASAEEVASCQDDVNTFMTDKKINFAINSADLAPDAVTVVDGLAEKLSGCAGMAIGVGGHTDATGSAETNKTLSQARAQSVAAALSERGVASEQITATGYGSSQPLIEGDGANAANRRIEFTLGTGDAGADAQTETSAEGAE